MASIDILSMGHCSSTVGRKSFQVFLKNSWVLLKITLTMSDHWFFEVVILFNCYDIIYCTLQNYIQGQLNMFSDLYL